MADVKIANLTAKTTWADTDIIIVEDATDTKKMTVATLKGLLNAQQAWQSPTLLNSWVDSGGGQAPVRYMKDTSGFVHIKGCCKSGSLTSSVFTLPAGYRPSELQNFIVASLASTGLVIVTSAGEVIAYYGSNTDINLAGITFRAEL